MPADSHHMNHRHRPPQHVHLGSCLLGAGIGGMAPYVVRTTIALGTAQNSQPTTDGRLQSVPVAIEKPFHLPITQNLIRRGPSTLRFELLIPFSDLRDARPPPAGNSLNLP
jgi:hypothetical protein